MKLNFPIIDLHAHLRQDIGLHTKMAHEAGISALAFMPNTNPCLDEINTIKNYQKQKSFVDLIPVGAISIGRRGKELVDIDSIKNHVLGFSDDGDCLVNIDLLKKAFGHNVLIMAHLEPEVEMTKAYIKALVEVKTGRLHIQHVSKKETIELIRKAKKRNLPITCETCPHYFAYNSAFEDKAVNPPLGNWDDIRAIKKGLADGTIDCITSDYAPIPRPKNTGFASFDAFIWLSFGLVLDGTLTQKQLKEKLYLNPLRILKRNYSNGYKKVFARIQKAQR